VLASWTSPRRWRTFADALALALGLNVWLALIFFPGLFIGAWSSKLHVVVAAMPLLALGFGVWRRSEALLLFGFPTALLLPVGVAPDLVTLHVYGPIHFAVVALGLVAYLFGASVFTSFYEPPEPVSTRPLASSLQPVPARWRRRARVYRYLVALSIAIPATLLYSLNFDDETREFIQRMYPGRAASFTAVVNLGLLAFWLVLYSRVFLQTLAEHRTGDRHMTTTLAVLRASLRRRSPRPAFYVAAAVALLLMAILVLTR